jgi:RES domain-containing protein
VIYAYRITKAKHSGTALSGEGARRAGGRWNDPGIPIVYCSLSLALAAMETFVHLTEEAASLRFASLEIGLPAAQVEVLEKLPKGWQNEPPGAASMQIGTEWAKASRSLALRVPSALIPSEWNILLNPAHPDFAKLAVSKAKPFSFDPRMWK